MTVFMQIVSISSGLTIILGLLSILIKPIREKITREKERREAEEKRQQDEKEQFEKLSGEIRELKSDVDNVSEALKEDKATRARTQILRFADEIYQHQKHTKEHFDETLDAIDYYNQFCEEHPDFKNYRTINAQKIINEVYMKCQKEHSFLGER